MGSRAPAVAQAGLDRQEAGTAGGPVETAADELRSLFKKRAGAECDGSRFEILVGVWDAQGNLDGTAVPDAAQLADLPNADQAYVIRPLGNTRLVLAAAWATRRGIRDRDAAAEWAVTLGPVGWDVYGSRIPFSHFFGRATAMVAGRRKPKLGDGMFRYFPSVEHMDEDLAACKKAMAIAERLDEPALIAET